jgi:prepilin-type N-terminal cleavage/methylation domain-containing protein
MKRAKGRKPQLGFTLIELLTAMGIFLLICGAAFTLLTSSQQRYQTESQVLNSFQEARLGLDQIVRDVNDSGFPPPTFNDGVAADAINFAVSPFAWSAAANYPPPGTCQIGTAGGGTCSTTAGGSSPGDFDLIIETNPNPLDPNCAPNCPVEWIRYQLQGTTLMRGMTPKVVGFDPDAATTATTPTVVLAPFVQNVVNNICPPQLPTCQTAYPGLFGGNPVPIFRYSCDNSSAPPPTAPCLGAGGDNSPANIREVSITLIVAAPLPDAATGRPRLVQLSGRGRRINPNQ